MECHRPQGRQEGRSQETTQRFSESCEQQASVQRTQNDEVLSTWERPLVPRHTTGRKYWIMILCLSHLSTVYDTLIRCRLLKTSAEAPALKVDTKLLINSIPSWVMMRLAASGEEWGLWQWMCCLAEFVWSKGSCQAGKLSRYRSQDSLNNPPCLIWGWGNNAAIYSANPAFFVSPTQTDGVLNCYSITSNMLNIHWHFNLVYYGELENLMSDTLTQGNVLAHRSSVYLPLSMQCLVY